MAPHRTRFDGDRHRPQFHMLPPWHWMNEPHAPVYFKGKYHIFYQHDPLGPFWGQIHWGHAVSTDMVHSRDLPVALAPAADSVGPDGIWSGSACVDGDRRSRSSSSPAATTVCPTASAPASPCPPTRPTATPTCPPGRRHSDRSPKPRRICLACPATAWAENFRDPFVWEEDGVRYQLVGSGILDSDGTQVTRKHGGTALLYAALTTLDGSVLHKATGTDDEAYRRVTWDAREHLGKQLRITLVDKATGGWGHINLDDVRVGTDPAPDPSRRGLAAHWDFAEGQGTTTREKVSRAADPISYVFNDARYKPDSAPLWREKNEADGVLSGALLFDGYSTWVTRAAAQTQLPTDGLTVEAWVAPRAFEWGDDGKPSAVVNQQDKAAKRGFSLGVGLHGRWQFGIGTGEAWYETTVPSRRPWPRASGRTCRPCSPRPRERSGSSSTASRSPRAPSRPPHGWPRPTSP
ncbi:hypothetical protein SGLAM104S_08296 [Streptomyces glaucescens]